MKHHVQLYLNHFNYSPGDFIPCEVCNSKAVDIHHIRARSSGGSKYRDYIENLMALCRSCHEKFGDKKQYREMLENAHRRKLENLQL